MDLYNELFPEDAQGEEKVASSAMGYFGLRFDERVEKLAAKAGVIGKSWKAVKDYHKGIGSDFRSAWTGKGMRASGKKGKMSRGKLTAGQRAAYAAKGVGKSLPHAAALGGAGYGAYKLSER